MTATYAPAALPGLLSSLFEGYRSRRARRSLARTIGGMDAARRADLGLEQWPAEASLQACNPYVVVVSGLNRR